MSSLPECLYCNGYLHNDNGDLITCDECPAKQKIDSSVQFNEGEKKP